MPTIADWEIRISSFVSEIAGDLNLSDADYIEVLEVLVDNAQTSIDAKKEELSREDADRG